jgi:hypothetical protein
VERAWEGAKEKITIQYPREFFVADILTELEKWAKAIAMDLGVDFEHFVKKRVVDQMAPDLPTDLKAAIHAAIDAQTSHRDQAMADARERLRGASERMADAGGRLPMPPNQGDGEAAAA